MYNLWHSVWRNFYCQNFTLISQNLVYGFLTYEQYRLTSQVKFIVPINKATNTKPNFPPVVHYIEFNLEQTTKAQRGNRGIALSLTSALDGGGWSIPRPGRFTPGKDPVLTVYGAVWVPGTVWTGAENLALTRIRSPDRPVSSESLYRLTYPGHVHYIGPPIYHIRGPCDDKARSPHDGVGEANYSLSAFYKQDVQLYLTSKYSFEIMTFNLCISFTSSK